MRLHHHILFAAVLAAAAPSITLAQATTAAEGRTTPPTEVRGMIAAVERAESKLVALAEAMPESTYDWRPGEGVRSVREVMLHVAAENYFLPAFAGVAPPEASGIKSGDFPSVQAYEARKASRAETVQALRESFAHFRQAMQATNEAFLAQEMELFGTKMTGLDFWLATTTHLHEHLGQAIAYARTNQVTPPWSR